MNNIMTSISYDVLQDILVERLGDVIYHTCAKDSLEDLRKNNYLRKSMIDNRYHQCIVILLQDLKKEKSI